MFKQVLRSIVGALLIAALAGTAFGQDDRAIATMRKAAEYYRNQVASRGGYVYHYTLDLQTRWGEGLADPETVWVQPPGTPTVGLAWLAAYRATKDKFYLKAATDAAEALVYGQLSSGGWTNHIDLSAADRQRFWGGRRRRDGNSSLDDGQTQTALRMIMHADQALGFKHEAIHESALLGIKSLLAAQFPNGAFPQVWTAPVRPQPIARPAYPDYDWRTEGRIKEYWDMYTLNDNVCGYVAQTLYDAHQIYDNNACFRALQKLGDFLVLAQMPEPQPAWAQQYNYKMIPIWARRFEPAGVSGDESQEAIETLFFIARATGDDKYLAPVPSALKYLKKSELPDGQLARYYELKTNRPLYMKRRGREYSLTYDDSQLPKHYGWKSPSRVDSLASELKRVRQQLREKRKGEFPPIEFKTVAQSAMKNLDRQGRWITTFDGERLVGQPKFRPGDKYLSSQVFSDNITALAKTLEESR